MVFVHFLLQGKKDVELAYFNHDTAFARKSENFVREYAENKNLKLSGVMFWQLAGDMPVTNEYSLLKAINSEMGLNSREKMAH